MDMPGQLTSVPTEEPTPEPTPAPTPEPIRFVFQPKVCSGYNEDHIVSCLDENDFGEWITFEFDYTGY